MKSFVCLTGLVLLFWIAPVRAAEPADFTGDWSATYGPLKLKQTGRHVTGSYDMSGTIGLVEGDVEGRRLVFTYREPNAAGEGWFELAADGDSFDGRWRADGDTGWSRWTGERGAAVESTAGTFDGVWSSSYGPLRLTQSGQDVRGFYRMADGRFADIAGTVKEDRLDFTYDEQGTKGTGHFELAPGGSGFTGAWQADGGAEGEWTGARIAALPGRVWLVILEARWENSLTDREYAYGTMLESYFARMQNVECRHRFFDDADSLARVCSEIPFLPEPAVVVIASHGSEEGLAVGSRRIHAEEIAAGFARADNVTLLHFSSCLIMAGKLPADISKALPAGISFPISGYTTSVDWGASAAAEFLYFDLILGRGLEPADAMQRLVKLLPVAGTTAPADSPFEPLGIRLVSAGRPAE